MPAAPQRPDSTSRPKALHSLKGLRSAAAMLVSLFPVTLSNSPPRHTVRLIRSRTSSFFCLQVGSSRARWTMSVVMAGVIGKIFAHQRGLIYLATS